jgi:hypothetical protein
MVLTGVNLIAELVFWSIVLLRTGMLWLIRIIRSLIAGWVLLSSAKEAKPPIKDKVFYGGSGARGARLRLAFSL